MELMRYYIGKRLDWMIKSITVEIIILFINGL